MRLPPLLLLLLQLLLLSLLGEVGNGGPGSMALPAAAQALQSAGATAAEPPAAAVVAAKVLHPGAAAEAGSVAVAALPAWAVAAGATMLVIQRGEACMLHQAASVAI